MDTTPTTRRSRLAAGLRFVREGWKDADARSQALLALPLPIWVGLHATVLAQSPWTAGVLGLCACAVSGVALLGMYRHGRARAAARASASLDAFLHAICTAIAHTRHDVDRCEISALDDGRFVADLLHVSKPYPFARDRASPLPSWVADQALHLVQAQGMRDSQGFYVSGLVGLWSVQANDVDKAPSAHARLSQRQALRDSLAPHLHDAFDSDPLPAAPT